MAECENKLIQESNAQLQKQIKEMKIIKLPEVPIINLKKRKAETQDKDKLLDEIVRASLSAIPFLDEKQQDAALTYLFSDQVFGNVTESRRVASLAELFNPDVAAKMPEEKQVAALNAFIPTGSFAKITPENKINAYDVLAASKDVPTEKKVAALSSPEIFTKVIEANPELLSNYFKNMSIPALAKLFSSTGKFADIFKACAESYKP